MALVTDHLNMSRTELRNAKLQGLSDAPFPEESVIYYDRDKKRVGIHDGDDWTYLSANEQEEIEFDFPIPELVWTIIHNDGSYPIPVVLDSINRIMIPDITYPDENTITITHSALISGKVKLKLKKL